MPGYPDAWTETLRKSHRLNFADPATLPAEADGATSLTLDVAPLVGLVVKQVADATTLPLEAPEQLLITIGQSEHRQLIERVSAYAPMGYAVAVGAADRLRPGLRRRPAEWTVLAGIGLGAPGAGRGLEAGRRRRRAAVTGTSAAATTWRRSSRASSSAPPPSSFGQWIVAAAVAGGVLLAAGLVLRVVGVRRRAEARHDRRSAQHR